MSFWCHHFDQNNNKNIVKISALNFFCSFLGAFWKLFKLPGDLVSNIIDKEAYRKPQRSYENFQGRNPYNVFVCFLVKMMTPKRHFEINSPLECINVLQIGINKEYGELLKKLNL